MSEKINVYTLHNKIKQLETVITNMMPRVHKYYDPRDYIKNYDGAIPIYKYNGIYYRTIADLVKHNTSISIDKRTIAAMIDNPARIGEAWSLGIQLEYIKETTKPNRFICTSGEVLMSNLAPLSNNLTMSLTTFISEGEPVLINRAKVVYKYFVSGIVNEMFFIDGVYGNCRIDNIVPNDKYIEVDL